MRHEPPFDNIVQTRMPLSFEVSKDFIDLYLYPLHSPCVMIFKFPCPKNALCSSSEAKLPALISLNALESRGTS